MLRFTKNTFITLLVVLQVATLVTVFSFQTGKTLTVQSALVDTSAHVQEAAVTSAVEKANPAVVSIIISKDLPILEQEYINPFGNDPFGNFFFQIPTYKEKGRKKQKIGGGTGFIVDSEGYIITNKHVVEDKDAEYTVLLNDERRFTATVLAQDPSNDIAVIKIDATGLPTLELGDSSTIKLGQIAITIGNALGEFRNTVSVGVISGLKRNITASGSPNGGISQLTGLIQTDASINHGNSGGPLLNLDGQVVGMNTAIAEGAQSIAFAIPINDVKVVYDMVKKTGKISRPYLGVRHMLVTKDLQEKNKLSVGYGALIQKSEFNEAAIVEGSPAEKAGLKEGDIILEVNREKVTKDNPLSTVILKYQVGDTVTLKVLREKKKINVKVTLEAR